MIQKMRRGVSLEKWNVRKRKEDGKETRSTATTLLAAGTYPRRISVALRGDPDVSEQRETIHIRAISKAETSTRQYTAQTCSRLAQSSRDLIMHIEQTSMIK